MVGPRAGRACRPEGVVPDGTVFARAPRGPSLRLQGDVVSASIHEGLVRNPFRGEQCPHRAVARQQPDCARDVERSQGDRRKGLGGACRRRRVFGDRKTTTVRPWRDARGRPVRSPSPQMTVGATARSEQAMRTLTERPERRDERALPGTPATTGSGVNAAPDRDAAGCVARSDDPDSRWVRFERGKLRTEWLGRRCFAGVGWGRCVSRSGRRKLGNARRRIIRSGQRLGDRLRVGVHVGTRLVRGGHQLGLPGGIQRDHGIGRRHGRQRPRRAAEGLRERGRSRVAVGRRHRNERRSRIGDRVRQRRAHHHECPRRRRRDDVQGHPCRRPSVPRRTRRHVPRQRRGGHQDLGTEPAARYLRRFFEARGRPDRHGSRQSTRTASPA